MNFFNCCGQLKLKGSNVVCSHSMASHSFSTIEVECLLECLSHLLSALHSIAGPRFIILSKSFTHCGHFCRATSIRVSAPFSVILSECSVLGHPE